MGEDISRNQSSDSSGAHSAPSAQRSEQNGKKNRRTAWSELIYVVVTLAGVIAIMLAVGPTDWATAGKRLRVSDKPEQGCKVIASRDIPAFSLIVWQDPATEKEDQSEDWNASIQAKAPNESISSAPTPTPESGDHAWMKLCPPQEEGLIMLKAVAAGKEIDLTSDVLKTGSLEDRHIVSVTVNDPAKLANPAGVVSLLFVETKDVRWVASNAAPAPRIDDALVLVVNSTDESTSSLVVAINTSDQNALATLARFANLVPAQVVAHTPSD